MNISKILFAILNIALIVFFVCSCSSHTDIHHQSNSESSSNIFDAEKTPKKEGDEKEHFDSTDTVSTEVYEETANPAITKEYNTMSLNGQLYAIFPFVDSDYSGQYDPETFSTHHYPTSDFDDTLDLLVAEYLSSGEGYEDILDIVYYQYVCDSTLLYSSYSMLEHYHNDGTIADFPEYMLREIMEDGRLGNEYYVARYGSLTTFDEYENYLKQHFDPEIISEIFNNSCPNVINVNGYIFARDCGIGKSGQERDPEYSLTVKKDQIVLNERRTVYDWNPSVKDMVPTDNFVYNDYILQRVKHGSEYVWQWQKINYCYSVGEEYKQTIK